MNILSQYHVIFFKKLIYNNVFYGANTINQLLDQFITEDQTIDDAAETIEALDSLLNEEIIKIHYSGQSLITLVANRVTSSIYDDPNLNSSFSLPTLDLKLIMQEWKHFLQGEGYIKSSH